ncbi:MAG: LON peptidase substrate-binding domain-containing protein [Geminicoccaceae bacterium]
MSTFSDHDGSDRDSDRRSEQGALSRLPSRFPIFPLSGAILLPGGNLPLNIFEPRYLQMIKDARRGDGIIGMIQPCGGAGGDGPGGDGPGGGSEDEPSLYPVGCAGQITNCETTEDGRNLITLTGLCRFDIAEELTVATPYRQVIADFDPWQGDLEPQSAPDTLRPHLVTALRRYFAVHDISVDWKQIERAPLSGLLTSLAMICPFEPPEKQALLETPDSAELGRTLVALLKMGTLASDDCSARH